MRYAKGIVAFLIPVGQAIQAAITDGTITPDEYVKIAMAVVLAAGVVLVPNAQREAPTRAAERARLATDIDQAGSSRIAEQRPDRRPRKPPASPTG